MATPCKPKLLYKKNSRFFDIQERKNAKPTDKKKKSKTMLRD